MWQSQTLTHTVPQLGWQAQQAIGARPGRCTGRAAVLCGRGATVWFSRPPRNGWRGNRGRCGDVRHGAAGAAASFIALPRRQLLAATEIERADRPRRTNTRHVARVVASAAGIAVHRSGVPWTGAPTTKAPASSEKCQCRWRHGSPRGAVQATEARFRAVVPWMSLIPGRLVSSTWRRRRHFSVLFCSPSSFSVLFCSPASAPELAVYARSIGVSRGWRRRLLP